MKMEEKDGEGKATGKGETIHGYNDTEVPLFDGRFMFTLEGSDIGTSDLS